MIDEYDAAAPDADDTETATFGPGCFWGPDARFGAIDGVVRTRVGYAGGTRVDPTYRSLGDHTEAVRVDYDPDRVSYADLLAVAFDNHNPRHRTARRQYRNVVFADSPARREALDENGFDAGGIETRIERLDRFYPAEAYHRKYRLKSSPSLLAPFEDAGYDEAEMRESPAAAKLNGVAGGHDLPEGSDLSSLPGEATSA